MNAVDIEYSHHGVLVDDLSSQVAALLERTFGVTSQPFAGHRVVARYRGMVVGHAALVSRKVSLGTWTGELLLLGLVAVDPVARHQGIGSALVGQAVQWAKSAGSAGVILNCGTGMVGFYQAAGFRKVSDRASYLRQGVVQVDDDPVMLFSFRSFEPQCLSDVFLGGDF